MDAELREENVEEFRVPKWQTPVEIALSDGTRSTYDLFLAERIAEANRPEHVSDRLSAPDLFLPVLDPAQGTVGFIRKASIAWARVSRDFEPISDDELPLRQEIRLILSGGQTLTGNLAWSVRPGGNRLQDALNWHEAWMRLVEPDSVVLVNKSLVLKVELTES